jgi:hypothetical protein
MPGIQKSDASWRQALAEPLTHYARQEKVVILTPHYQGGCSFRLIASGIM